MKAEQEKPEAAKKKYCKDCRFYSRPECKEHKGIIGGGFFTARKSTCPDWAGR